MKRLTFVLLAALFTSVATAGPPEYSGVVVRGTTPALYVFVDEDSDLVAAFGGDPYLICSGNFDEDDIDWIAWQDMNMPNGFRWVTINKGRDVQTFLYRLSQFAESAGFCEGVLAGVAPFGTLEVNFRYQDNDYPAAENCEFKENFNTYGWTFEGPLYSDDGRKRQFSGRVRQVWDCDTSRIVHVDTKLLLTK